MIEEFIPGREFTVLVAAAGRFHPLALQPIEFLFPAGAAFKTYDLKVAQHHPECNVPVTDSALGDRAPPRRLGNLHRVRRRGLRAPRFPHGRCRSPRLPRHQLRLLRFLPARLRRLRRLYPQVRSARPRRVPPPHRRRWDCTASPAAEDLRAARQITIAGSGIYAQRAIGAGEIVFRGEERAHRLVTMSHVASHWPARRKSRYSDATRCPPGGTCVSSGTRTRANGPRRTIRATQIPRIAASTWIAIRDIRGGDELTLDYAACCDETMAAFQCACGSPNCRGTIVVNGSGPRPS